MLFFPSQLLPSGLPSGLPLHTRTHQTLMSVDADRLVNLCYSFHELWSLPAQTALALALLYSQAQRAPVLALHPRCAVLCCAVLCCAVLCCAVLRPRCAALPCIALPCDERSQALPAARSTLRPALLLLTRACRPRPQVRYAFLAGLALVLLLIPANRWLANRIQAASVEMMGAKDRCGARGSQGPAGGVAPPSERAGEAGGRPAACPQAAQGRQLPCHRSNAAPAPSSSDPSLAPP